MPQRHGARYQLKPVTNLIANLAVSIIRCTPP